jgi:hypothetical protein
MEDGLLYITIGAISAALLFDFVNGFHDSANAIATVVGTRTLKPLHAVFIASITNFIAGICYYRSNIGWLNWGYYMEFNYLVFWIAFF